MAAVPLHLDLLAGISLGGASQLVFGPGVYGVFTLLPATAGLVSNPGAFTFLAGGTLGISFAISPTFRLMPEFDIYFPVAGVLVFPEADVVGTYAANGAFIYTVAIGLTSGNGSTASRASAAAR